MRIIALIVIVGSIALALSSMKLPSSTIDLDVAAQSVALGVTKEPVTLDPFLVTKATFYGPGSIETSDGSSSFRSMFTLAGDLLTSPLTFQSIKLEPGVTVRIRKQPGGERAFDILLESPKGWLFSTFAQGRFDTETDGQSHAVQSQAPKTFRVRLPKGVVRLSVTLAEEVWTGRMTMPVASVSFFDGGEKDGVPFRFSALDRGHVRFGDIELDDGKNKEMELRPGQPFLIAPATDGVVRFLKLSKEGVALQYSGGVSAIATGWNEASLTSHMPSLLSFIFSKDWVKQGLAIVFSLLGLTDMALGRRASK
jgi:hypothetical protein